jgi:threonine/homoserine/homoserine lactone efflux protein
MLTLEAIAVLGIVYLFFMVATVRATRAAEREARRERERRAARQRRIAPIGDAKPVRQSPVS